jgi:nucleoside-diphosphate-sugar epimerase
MGPKYKASVLIIGGTGFVGSALAHALVRRGQSVAVLARPSSDCRRLAGIEDELTIVRCESEQDGELASVMSQHAPEIVIDTAVDRQAGYAATPEQAAAFFSRNTRLAFEITRAMREAPPRLFIQSTSQNEQRWSGRPIHAHDPLDPENFFGVAKAACTMIFREAARNWSIPLVTLRLFTVFGPGEPGHRLVPMAARAALEGKTLPLTGGVIEHDWIYIDDVVAAYLAVIDSELTDGIFQVASGVATSNAEVVRLVGASLGRPVRVDIGAFPARAVDRSRWCADISLNRECLGWVPRIGIEEGIELTVRYWRAQFEL